MRNRTELKRKINLLTTLYSILAICLLFAGDATAQQINSGNWISKASVPTARIFPAAGVINGKFYLAGGHDGPVSLTTLEVYDPVTDLWNSKTPMSAPREGSGYGVINGKLYVAGGSILTETGGDIINILEVYDPITNIWLTKAPMPVAVVVPACAVVNNKLYISGGATTSGYTNILQVYDPATDKWEIKAAMPTIRAYPVAAEINGKLYVVGGAQPFAPLTGVLEVYDPVTNSWSNKATMPTPRYAHEAVAINGKLYVIGGDPSDSGVSSESNIIEVYDSATNTWSTAAPMPTARYGMGVAVVNNRIYVAAGGIGGSGTGFGIALNVNEVFNPGNEVGNCDQLQQQIDLLQADLAAANQTIQQQQAQLAIANQNIMNLQDRLTVANNMVQMLNNGLANGGNSIIEDFRTLFNNPQFTIAGATPLAQFQSLVNGILQSNKGSKQQIYQNLAGK